MKVRSEAKSKAESPSQRTTAPSSLRGETRHTRVSLHAAPKKKKKKKKTLALLLCGALHGRFGEDDEQLLVGEAERTDLAQLRRVESPRHLQRVR